MVTVEAMFEGGKESAAPPLGPALGPAGVPISQVIDAINKKTAATSIVASAALNQLSLEAMG